MCGDSFARASRSQAQQSACRKRIAMARKLKTYTTSAGFRQAPVPGRAGPDRPASRPADQPQARRARAPAADRGPRACGPGTGRPAEGRLMPSPDSAIVTIKVPFAVRKRGGRKLVLAPDGAPMPRAAPHVDSTLVKAIARAFRWQKMLETGRYTTIKEIANAERINRSYVSRVRRLTLFAPGTLEASWKGARMQGRRWRRRWRHSPSHGQSRRLRSDRAIGVVRTRHHGNSGNGPEVQWSP